MATAEGTRVLRCARCREDWGHDADNCAFGERAVVPIGAGVRKAIPQARDLLMSDSRAGAKQSSTC